MRLGRTEWWVAAVVAAYAASLPISEGAKWASWAVIIGAALGSELLHRDRRQPLSLTEWLGFLLCASLAASSIVSADTGHSIRWMTKTLSGVVLFWALRRLAPKWPAVQPAFAWPFILAGGTALVIAAFVVPVRVVDRLVLYSLGHYNYSGTYLLVTGILAAVLGVERTRPWRQRVLLWAVVAACVYGVFLTQSRGAWLAMVLLYFFWVAVNVRRVWKRALALAGAVAGYLLLPAFYQERLASILYPWRDESFMQRVDAWKFAATLYEQHPILGYGLATYQSWCLKLDCPAPIGHPHNAYLHFLFEAGPASLLLLLAFLGSLLRDLWRRRDDSPYAQAGLLATLALMVHGMVGLTFRDEQLAAALALAALGLAPRGPSGPALEKSQVGSQGERP